MLASLGIQASESLFWSPHLVAWDTESEQSSLLEDRSAEDAWTVLTLPMFAHDLFCISLAFTETGDAAESWVLFRGEYLDSVSLVWDFVGQLINCAERQKQARLGECESLMWRIRDEIGKATRAGKTYFVRRLSKCLEHIERKCGTLVVVSFNGAKFDTPLVARAGFLAVLRAFFPTVEILKKGRNYQAITSWNRECGVGLRFVDQLCFITPTTLAKFLDSNMALLPPDYRIPKTHLPFFNLHKIWTKNWQEADYQFVLGDFEDKVMGGNLLGRGRGEYEARLKECDGDTEAALRGLGLSQEPATAEGVFEELRREWAAKGLATAKAVTSNYAAVDVIPLALIAVKRSQQILKETSLSLYTSFSSISSFAFTVLVRSALTGSSPMSFLPLGARLGRLLRHNIRGGPSFLALR
jgi:hypothetical protein